MTLSDIDSRVDLYTKTSTSQYTAAQRLISLNNAIDKINTMIWQSQDGWDFDDSNQSDFPIFTADLVVNQQDYSLPASVVNIKRLEISYDGINWYKAEPFDINERGYATDTDSIDDSFEETKPKYDISYGSIFLYPIPDTAVTGGLKIWADRNATQFTSSDVSTGTKSPGFDRQFHEMVPLMMALDWGIAGNLPQTQNIKTMLDDYEFRLRNHYGKKQKDRNYIFKKAYIDYN